MYQASKVSGHVFVCLPISAIVDDILNMKCSDSVVFKFVSHFIFNIRSRHEIAEILLKLALNTIQSSLRNTFTTQTSSLF
jgi:hypothetical protein